MQIIEGLSVIALVPCHRLLLVRSNRETAWAEARRSMHVFRTYAMLRQEIWCWDCANALGDRRQSLGPGKTRPEATNIERRPKRDASTSQ